MKPLSTPAAILLGFGLFGSLTALGLFFGLRGRSEAGGISARVPTPLGPTENPSAAKPAPAPGLPLTGAPSPVETAKHSIEAQHAHLVDKCWNPSVAKRPLPATVTLTLTLDYAPDGRLAVNSLQQDAANARPDVTICVEKELVRPTVDPPGRRVRIVVPITLP